MNTANRNVKSNSNMQDKTFSVKKAENPTRIFTGTIDKIIHWAQVKDKANILFEIIANVVNIQQGTHPTQKILIIQDERNTPCLKVVYYEIDQPLPRLMIGSIVKCIGKIISRDVIHAFKVSQSSLEEKKQVDRVAFICDYTIKKELEKM